VYERDQLARQIVGLLQDEGVEPAVTAPTRLVIRQSTARLVSAR
jgi:hypothetical protein